MRSQNILSFYQGVNALDKEGLYDYKRKGAIKRHEITTLGLLCDELIKNEASIKDLDGYFISYEIPQLGNEFDLLRFGSNYNINIEFKIHLDPKELQKRIDTQLKKNLLYLNALQKDVYLFEYIVDVGLYKFDLTKSTCVKSTMKELVDTLKNQIVDYNALPQNMFIPSNYLVSPFNNTQRFLNDEYFLTMQQNTFKKDILSGLRNKGYNYYAISGEAGTGKTLLLYDIAKEIRRNEKCLIIHCGKLNEGHYTLKNSEKWDIICFNDIPYTIGPNWNSSPLNGYSYVLVDEAQRISNMQLEYIIEYCENFEIPVVFSYDIKQYLKDKQIVDIKEYLDCNHKNLKGLKGLKLTNTIRTNNEIIGFIDCLFDNCNKKCNCSRITIEYYDNIKDLNNYVWFLSAVNWKVITYTPYVVEQQTNPYKNLSNLTNASNAHEVIGQEFNKVVAVLDEHFYYENNKLIGEEGYYSGLGMFYQAVTRATDELKIIVVNNPQLYAQILKIIDIN